MADLRIRQVKPGFFNDPITGRELSFFERLLYIGLWLFADDSGWFRNRMDEFGAAVLPYEDSAGRQAAIESAMDHFEAIGRISRYDCGHGQIPTLTRHQRLAGTTRRVHTFRDEHAQNCSVSPARGEARGSPRFPDRNGKEGDGLERDNHPSGTMDEIVLLVEERLGGRVSADQRSLIVEVADHHDVGDRGLRRVLDKLRASADRDPIAFLKAEDGRLKAAGRASADAQEAESARWRTASCRRDGLTTVDGRSLTHRLSAAKPATETD